ncbi:MAG: hypothetical protein R2864_09035 [Syntrophotaleaceae bacterium]
MRGSGGTLWGANAVNGVINIITKKARDTHGPDHAGYGPKKRALPLCVTVGVVEQADYRAFVKNTSTVKPA